MRGEGAVERSPPTSLNPLRKNKHVYVRNIKRILNTGLLCQPPQRSTRREEKHWAKKKILRMPVFRAYGVFQPTRASSRPNSVSFGYITSSKTISFISSCGDQPQICENSIARRHKSGNECRTNGTGGARPYSSSILTSATLHRLRQHRDLDAKCGTFRWALYIYTV